MKKYILAIMLFVLPFTASAIKSVDVQGLSPTQKAELALQVEQMKAQASPLGFNQPKTVEEVKEWVEIGAAVGEGLASAAGKLGVEVNEFASSTVGKFTMFIIAWSYVGQELIAILFGACLFIFGIPTWIWMYRTRGSMRVSSVRTYDKGEGPGNARSVTEYTNTSETLKGWYVGILLVIMVLGTLTIIV